MNRKALTAGSASELEVEKLFLPAVQAISND